MNELQNETINRTGLYSAQKISYWFLDRDQLTHRKIQLLCYYAQAWSCALNNRKLIRTDFYAWMKGPTSRKIYKEFLDCLEYEDGPIVSLWWHLFEFDTKEDEDILKYVWQKYGNKTDKELTDLAMHEQPWLEAQRNYATGQWDKPLITIESMQKYYRSIYEGTQLVK